MKILKPLLYLSMSFMVLGGAIQTVYGDSKTEGVVEFTAGEGEDQGPIKLIKPGTEKELISIDQQLGNRTTGGLRFAFVPNFEFEQAELSVVDQTYYAQTIPYTYVDSEAGQGTHYLPPFLQVVNESGLDHQFAVSAWATNFKSSSNHELVNSRMKLADFSARNTALDSGASGAADEGYGNVDAVAENYLRTPNLSSFADKRLTIPTKQSEAVSIFSSADGEKTRGTASSLVFQKNYSPKERYEEKAKTEAVMLEVPATDKPKKEVYYSVITWELEDTI